MLEPTKKPGGGDAKSGDTAKSSDKATGKDAPKKK